jgi:hypothetical protein
VIPHIIISVADYGSSNYGREIEASAVTTKPDGPVSQIFGKETYVTETSYVTHFISVLARTDLVNEILLSCLN